MEENAKKDIHHPPASVGAGGVSSGKKEPHQGAPLKSCFFLFLCTIARRFCGVWEGVAEEPPPQGDVCCLLPLLLARHVTVDNNDDHDDEVAHIPPRRSAKGFERRVARTRAQ